MTEPDGEAVLLTAFADRLRDAHRKVPQLPVSDDEKGRAARRLLAISDAAKHDVRRASARLDALLADWAEGRIGAADDAPEPPAGPSPV